MRCKCSCEESFIVGKIAVKVVRVAWPAARNAEVKAGSEQLNASKSCQGNTNLWVLH